jgi:Tol biopolymer transport system component
MKRYFIISFNNGKGGKAMPIEGASNNGLSNYFPRVSPDGKWLLFCQAESFMIRHLITKREKQC